MQDALDRDATASGQAKAFVRPQGCDMRISLLTGGGDKPYVFGLATALSSNGVWLDCVGSDEIDCPEFHICPNLTFLNLRGSQRSDSSVASKMARIVVYYARLLRYVAVARTRILHILWNNKFQTFDRTVLMLYYRLLGKKVVLTAHNVNTAKRDASDSFLNRTTLRIQYRLADHIFVHNDLMKNELVGDFGVDGSRVTVIPLGINNSVRNTSLTAAQAKRQLHLDDETKTLLFYGHIGPYKGLEYLVAAFQQVAASDPSYRLLITGKPKLGAEQYFAELQSIIRRHSTAAQVVQRIEFVPDEETEMYFKAADVLVLPYTQVYESGVLVLGYNFGLPVVAADVGRFSEEVVEGRTGFICRSADAVDLAAAIERYFRSDLFKNLEHRRGDIRDYANSRRSWDVIADTTIGIYSRLATR